MVSIHVGDYRQRNNRRETAVKSLERRLEEPGRPKTTLLDE
jgi:hypothetical protein